jgi:hypothetical protein
MLSQINSSEDEEEDNGSEAISGKSVEKISINSKSNDENVDNIIIDDKNDKKLIRKLLIPTKKSPFSVYKKEDLLSICRNAFAFHRLSCGSKLMSALSVDKRTPHFFILKAALILFTQNNNNNNNNSLLTQSMKKVSKYDINKKEIMLEMIINYIRNNDRIGAKEYIEANQTYIKFNLCRSHPIIDAYLKCYISYCDYWEWKESINESKNSYYYSLNESTKLISDKTKLALKKIITDSKDCQLDIFVLILLQMYEYNQQFDEAIDLLQLYVNYNSNHLNAFIYLYEFCLKYDNQYSTVEQEVNALKNICRLSPDHILVLELVKKNVLSVEQNFELIMEFIDYTPNNYNLSAWILLRDTLNVIKKDNRKAKSVVKIWKQRYKPYWIRSYFNASSIDKNSVHLIRCKQEIISCLESNSHQFILETNKKLKKKNL